MTNDSQIITNGARTTIIEGDLCYKIVGCLINVSQKYGYLHKEKVYQEACQEEFNKSALDFIREPKIPIFSVDTGARFAVYNPDFLVQNKVIIEIKALRFTDRNSIYQLEQYLRASDKEVGILVNFGVPRADIIRRIYTNDRKSWLKVINS